MITMITTRRISVLMFGVNTNDSGLKRSALYSGFAHPLTPKCCTRFPYASVICACACCFIYECVGYNRSRLVGAKHEHRHDVHVGYWGSALRMMRESGCHLHAVPILGPATRASIGIPQRHIPTERGSSCWLVSRGPREMTSTLGTHHSLNTENCIGVLHTSTN